MSNRQPSIGWRLRRSIASAVICLGGLGLALGVPASAAAADVTAASGSAAVVTTTCTDGHWPASVQGRPRFHAGSPAGDYIWHDASGWHLRVTHAGSRRVVFSGTITSDQPMQAQGVLLEKNDHFTLSADKLTLTYRFVNYGRIDGLNFRTACASTLSFLGNVSGHKLGVGRIWIGHNGRHPLENPFTISRLV